MSTTKHHHPQHQPIRITLRGHSPRKTAGALEKIAAPDIGRKFQASTPIECVKVSGYYEILEARALLTSSDVGYDQTLQPRDRHRTSSSMQIAHIMKHFEAERLGQAPTTDFGAPCVDKKNQVLSGNGRVKVLRQLYNDTHGVIYRNWLDEKAQDFGISPMMIRRVENPVLVRRVLNYGGLTPAEFARQANQRQVLGMSEVENAVADAGLLLAGNQRLAKLLQPEAEGNLMKRENCNFVKGFVHATGDEAELMTAKSFNWPVLVRRVKYALLVALLGPDITLLQSLIECADELGLKNIVICLMACAPSLLPHKGNAYDLGPAMHQALSDLVNMKRNNEKLEDFRRQLELITTSNRTPESVALLDLLAESKRTNLKIVLHNYANIASEEMETMEASGGLFKDPVPSIIEVFMKAMFQQQYTPCSTDLGSIESPGINLAPRQSIARK